MTLEYQIYDFVDDNEITFYDDGKQSIGEYIIHSFGRTIDDKSVYAKIKGYEPRFYIELPSDWNKYGFAGCCEKNGGAWTQHIYTAQ